MSLSWNGLTFSRWPRSHSHSSITITMAIRFDFWILYIDKDVHFLSFHKIVPLLMYHRGTSQYMIWVQTSTPFLKVRWPHCANRGDYSFMSKLHMTIGWKCRDINNCLKPNVVFHWDFQTKLQCQCQQQSTSDIIFVQWQNIDLVLSTSQNFWGCMQFSLAVV